jgi:hypothetical protein
MTGLFRFLKAGFGLSRRDESLVLSNKCDWLVFGTRWQTICSRCYLVDSPLLVTWLNQLHFGLYSVLFYLVYVVVLVVVYLVYVVVHLVCRIWCLCSVQLLVPRCSAGYHIDFVCSVVDRILTFIRATWVLGKESKSKYQRLWTVVFDIASWLKLSTNYVWVAFIFIVLIDI